MNLSDFHFPFDPTLVAKHPIHPRDHARLLVLNRHQGQIADRQVKDLPEILQPGDLLVVNDTKVIPARLLGKKVPSGGHIEMLFVKDIDATHAEVLMNGRVGIGQRVEFQGAGQAQVVEKQPGRTVIHWLGPDTLQVHLQKFGALPLPPYLKREPVAGDDEDYQTMFANVEGAVASPTASLHFTPSLIQALLDTGIGCARITLHVGPGTFQPVKTEVVEEHMRCMPNGLKSQKMSSNRFKRFANVEVGLWPWVRPWLAVWNQPPMPREKSGLGPEKRNCLFFLDIGSRWSMC